MITGATFSCSRWAAPCFPGSRAFPCRFIELTLNSAYKRITATLSEMALLAMDPHAVSIPLAMLVVFGFAKLFAEILERFGQPGIVGEILAGAIVGPSMLGWIQPNEVLTALSELGVMFLLFRVGLEVKSSELMQVGGTAFLVALLGVVVPIGYGLGHHARRGVIPKWNRSSSGAAMVATSVGITAQVLAAKGLLHLQSAKIILGRRSDRRHPRTRRPRHREQRRAKDTVNLTGHCNDCGDGDRIHASSWRNGALAR